MFTCMCIPSGNLSIIVVWGPDNIWDIRTFIMITNLSYGDFWKICVSIWRLPFYTALTDCGVFFCFGSDLEFSEFDWKGSAWNLLSHCALPVSHALCRQRRWRLFILVCCLAFWSPLIIYNGHLAGLHSEPMFHSFFAVLSETAKEITVEIAGDFILPSTLWKLFLGVLETEMIAWELYRQLYVFLWSQLFQCQDLCF